MDVQTETSTPTATPSPDVTLRAGIIGLGSPIRRVGPSIEKAWAHIVVPEKSQLPGNGIANGTPGPVV